MSAPIPIPIRRPNLVSSRSVMSKLLQYTESIRGRAGGKGADQVTNSIDGIDDAGTRGTTLEREVEVLAILMVAIDRAHERSIITVDSRVGGGYGKSTVELSHGKH